jgi:hypothetical protein
MYRALYSRMLIFILVFQCAFTGAYAFLSFQGPHGVGIGPEIYFMQRKKDGGSNQRGFMYGARFNYDRIRKSSLYWGAEAQWATGTLCGHNTDHVELKSRKRDSEIEGRLGYTWKRKLGCNFWITPFLGGGYFEGTNRFVKPTPLEYKITNFLPYLVSGFLWRIDVKPCFSIGLNLKVKYSVGAHSHISDDPDPEVNNERLVIEDKFSYNVDVPFYFDFSCGGKKMEVTFSPFYHFRHYGAHENHPYDFIDTRFHMYGARLMFSCLF